MNVSLLPGEQRIFLSRAVLPRRERRELQEKGRVRKMGPAKLRAKKLR